MTGWARDGLTEAQIAHNIGIHISTMEEWKGRFPEFSEALKKGKAPADYYVVNKLYESALGYKVTVKRPFKLKTKKQLAGKGTIEEEHIEYAEEEIYIPASNTAQIYWLNNRLPGQWSNKPTVENKDTAERLDRILEEVRRVAYTETS